MQIYSVEKTNNGYILKKKSIDFNFFNSVETKSGDIRLIPKEVKELNLYRDIKGLKDYNFNILDLLSVECNGKDREVKNVMYTLHEIYHMIGDGGKIVRNSCLNIQTMILKGWNYSRRLGISYPPCDNNLCVAEIYRQAIANNIWLKMCFKINNDLILKITTSARE